MWWLAVLSYALLVAYGSLYPFSGWRTRGVDPFSFLLAGVPDDLSAPDLFVNVAAYVPLGFLLCLVLLRRRAVWFATLFSIVFSTSLSLGMESLQSFMPARVASLVDLVVNAGGAIVGAALALLIHWWRAAHGRLKALRNGLLRHGDFADMAFAVAALSMFVMLGPLIPSLDAAGRLMSVAPAWRAFLDVSQFDVLAVIAYALQLLGLLSLCAVALRSDIPRLAVLSAVLTAALLFKFAVAVLYLNVPFHSWIVSGKALFGIVAGIAAFALLLRRSEAVVAGAGCIGLMASYVILQLADGSADRSSLMGASVHPMNWIPFSGQMHGSTGIIDIVAALASFLSLGLLANAVTPYLRRPLVIGAGTVLVAGLALGTEWMQQQVPGRYADATDAVLATLGWMCAWFWLPLGELPTSRRESPGGAEAPRRVRRALVWLAPGTLAGAIVIGAVAALATPVEVPLSGSSLPLQPLPADLPPVALPSFKLAHPRLPAPTEGDIAQLRIHGGAYLAERQRQANHGSGNLEAAIFCALAEPGSQDLDLIYLRLMKEKFHYRGNGTEIVALGYDWLYDQWSDEQRRNLQGRLVEAFEFTYKVIRNERLSPYNVYLYNSPFQRLLAVAIALYRDDPRGDAAMRAADYLLHHDVLPAWRQVMGQNGGWHEGGEYVGIGIGQAIYRVPAMWRAATGEDLFRSEPGIKGFLDFLVYRMRPDGSHFRWGDGGFFHRIVPDQWALALEYRDAAAYSLGPGKARDYAPTSWPWGPLGDPSLIDPLAVGAKPLSKLFDGIGLVVARSDWQPEATYVTFRAGDNYWSHQHLDQGAFTIFKGGALAIDSGFYGPHYVSDHHMKYGYQTIAHNTLTVTDPADTVDAMNKKGESRHFANDGGQRRVGSGWGVEPAPINIDEWKLKREIYHTGTMSAYYEGDGLTVAVADITPAYTNSFSGEGTFSHRTRRVERAWRIFAYDRVDDVVVVQDQLVSSEPSFAKRWLLHTLERPRTDGSRFEIRTPKADGLPGGTLAGVALFPSDGRFNVIGGPGFEFFVDGVNYDEQGTLAKSVARKRDTQPGAWRIELRPGANRSDDRFLVVMLPSLATKVAPQSVTRLEQDGRYGCQIVGLQRTTRWWFTRGSNEVEIEISTPSETQIIRVGGETPPAG
jgi:VanZ family protein